MKLLVVPNDYRPVQWASRLALAILLGFFVVCAVDSQASARKKAPQIHPNVVLITVDTLRADRLGIYGNSSVPTPNIDALGAEGTVFFHAYSQVPLTLPSHTTLFTGTYPMWHGVRDLSTAGVPGDIPTIAEIFKSHGYRTAAFISAFVLNSTWGLNRGFDVYDDGPIAAEDGRRRLERPAQQTINSATQWLKGVRPGKFFLWVHLYDPHAPYAAPEPFRSRFATLPYDGEVAYVDSQLGLLINRLKELKLYASSVIVVAGDHGEALGEHQEREHGFFAYNSTLRVPLLIRLPGGKTAGGKVDAVASLLDVAPTLMQACGFVIPRNFQGHDLFAPASNDPPFAYSESLYPNSSFGWHSLRSVQNGRYHYIEAAESELYDIEEDPQELHNILDEKPAVAAALQNKLASVSAQYQRRATQQSPATDIERSRNLQALGYVGTSAMARAQGDATLAADPKEKIGLYNDILRATELTDEGDFQKAEAAFADLTLRNPDLFLLPYLRAENLFASGAALEAKVQYKHAIDLNPQFDLAAMGLGHAAYRAGDDAEALTAYKLALEINPRNFLVRLALAKTYLRLRQLENAAREQWIVLHANPRLPQARMEYARTLILQSNFPEALKILRGATENSPGDRDTYNLLGTVLVHLSRFREAIQAYQRAIELDPSYAAAYASLALIYYKMQDHANFRAYQEKTCRMDAELCRTIDPGGR